MIKKTVTYVDFNDVERTEDFYFNLSKAEITEMEISHEGGLKSTLEKVIAAKDEKQVMEIFKDLVLKAYGEKSPDGKRFMKSDEIRANFVSTQAYSDIFMELVQDELAAVGFVEGISTSLHK